MTTVARYTFLSVSLMVALNSFAAPRKKPSPPPSDPQEIDFVVPESWRAENSARLLAPAPAAQHLRVSGGLRSAAAISAPVYGGVSESATTNPSELRYQYQNSRPGVEFEWKGPHIYDRHRTTLSLVWGASFWILERSAKRNISGAGVYRDSQNLSLIAANLGLEYLPSFLNGRYLSLAAALRGSPVYGVSSRSALGPSRAKWGYTYGSQLLLNLKHDRVFENAALLLVGGAQRFHFDNQQSNILEARAGVEFLF